MSRGAKLCDLFSRSSSSSSLLVRARANGRNDAASVLHTPFPHCFLNAARLERKRVSGREGSGVSVGDESQKVCINRPLYITSMGYADEPLCLNNFPLLFVIRIQGKVKKALKGEQDDLFKPAHEQIRSCVWKVVLLCVY